MQSAQNRDIRAAALRKVHTLLGILAWTLRNRKWAQASRQRLRIRELLTLANMEIGAHSYHDSIYAQRVQEFGLRLSLRIVNTPSLQEQGRRLDGVPPDPKRRACAELETFTPE